MCAIFWLWLRHDVTYVVCSRVGWVKRSDPIGTMVLLGVLCFTQPTKLTIKLWGIKQVIKL